jgi:Mg2+-importing ATPase
VKDLEKVDEVAFDFSRKRLSIVVRSSDGKERLVCKGAAEEVLAVSTVVSLRGEEVPFTGSLRADALAQVRQLNEKGMRVLAVAYRDLGQRRRTYSTEDERDLVLVGLLGFLDPPKETAAAAIRGLHELGVEVKVLTGDNEIVAGTICEQVGIPVNRMLTGGQVEPMSDGELSDALREVSVLAKLTPLQKARVVRVLQDSGNTVGFMGDGINDAAALRAADVGISVDTAVDIAKESANIILLEKSLTVLENGIVEGRGVYANIIKYIKITASSNFGNVFSIVAASIFLPFLPMLPLQLLTLSLVYNIANLALPFDKVDRDFVATPRRWDSPSLVRFMLYLGPVSSVYDLVTFFVLFFAFGASTIGHQAVFQTGWFIESMATQALVVHMLRTDKIPFLQSRAAPAVELGTVGAIAVACVLPYTAVGHAIGLTGMPWMFWPVVVLILAAYLMHAQTVKWAYRRRFGGEWL